jgi:hypothetical protein
LTAAAAATESVSTFDDKIDSGRFLVPIEAE